LGTIRTAMRADFAENSAFPATAVGDNPIALGIGFNATDLTGRFFEDDDYAFSELGTNTTYCIGVTADVGGAAPSDAAANAGIIRSMDEEGTIFQTVDCT